MSTNTLPCRYQPVPPFLAEPPRLSLAQAKVTTAPSLMPALGFNGLREFRPMLVTRDNWVAIAMTRTRLAAVGDFFFLLMYLILRGRAYTCLLMIGGGFDYERE